MLLSLSVKNFAIIDNIEIDFNDGMTVLTGETGAGKSLIIDAISLLFGARSSFDLVRNGEAKATINGSFTTYDEDLINILEEMGIEYDLNDTLFIKREIYANGKSICKVNNENVSLNDLKRIGEYIGDIHSQEDSFGLINPKNYLNFLKNKEISDCLNEYKTLLKEYNNAKANYNNELKENLEISKQIDFLNYQYNEFKLAKLEKGEEERLNDELKYLSNYNNILEHISAFKDIYDDKGALDLVYESLSHLSKLASFDERYEELHKNLEEAYYNIEAVIDNSLFKVSNIDFDEERLEEINSRLGLYSDLKRKYKMNTDELIEYAKEIKEKLESIENFDSRIEELKKEYLECLKKLTKVALNLRRLRQEFSKDLVSKIKTNLLDLELKNAEFEICFNEVDEDNLDFYNNGIDSIDFLVSFNKGERPLPLSKVASGGELSRFMLAIKTVLGENLPMQTKIFDEIDSGVSGACAYAIALKIKEISKRSQVLCITHLPQVASIANTQLKISKFVNEGRTYTVICELDSYERMDEIASMISNGNITPASLNLARELLEESGNLNEE